MRRYETLLVLNPELPEAQTRETIDRAKRLLLDSGVEECSVQEWGMRDLAYEIRKHKRGYYVLLEYKATPEIVNELERQLKITDEALRFISVAVPKNARKRTEEATTPAESEKSEPAAAELGEAAPTTAAPPAPVE